jgi:hypothetical protein
MFGIGPLVQLVLPRFEMRLASDMTATAQS